ncbi:putative transcriptional regulator with HTH domain [Spongiibacter sp. IMCC21906]|uniref:ATP-binding protein n=1 Tax=Spongiibacter sp. IMCC21906 TaxID=1620392 RepID=UPI00062DD04B|nr:ATP-binding protein [Spongiibacter sp. IMCC21906]AKH68163.1 putative transcriptional regulator with HTH domain [Spongiibacter sp. IMCC21906]
MTVDRSQEYLQSLLKELCSLPQETEWVEFKHNNDDAPLIGEYISALANSAALLGKQSAYVVWGVENDTHEVIGTTFKPSAARHKQQELESWLLQKISPKIHFRFFEFVSANGLSVVILEMQAATNNPVQFEGIEFIRVGSYKKKLKEYPEKERALWRIFDKTPFERQMAASNLSADEVLKLLDYPAYFELTSLPLPDNRAGILNALKADQLIQEVPGGQWGIANLGAILFAKKLQNFQHLGRKAVRLILYRGNSRIETVREFGGNKGYAVGFEGLIDYIKTLLPSNEEIGKAFRKEVPMYPELAIRELVANAIIHQDFTLTGTGPMIELFDKRMEITNPGVPLVDTQRFLDSPPQSRNEALASFMRRINICEERGSGVDKVIGQVEVYQLPAPIFEKTDQHTRVVLFTYKDFKDMESEDRIRACYQHCCLKYVNREPMNNTSLRERFRIEEGNSAMASRIIKQTVEAGLIRLHDSTANRRAYRYVPFWA